MTTVQEARLLRTIILPVVRLPIIASWYPEARVILLKADGDDPSDQQVQCKELTIRSFNYGVINYRSIRSITLYCDRGGTWEADTLGEIQSMVASSDSKLKRVNVSRLNFSWMVNGRQVELRWRRMTAHPGLFVSASPGSIKPGARLAEILTRIKGQLVAAGKIPEGETHEYKSSALMLTDVLHFHGDGGRRWHDPANILAIQQSLGDMARVMDIVEVAARKEDLKEPEME